MTETSHYPGIYRGIVHDTRDPLGKGRIKVRVNQILGSTPTTWAWPIASTSNTEIAAPAVGDGVFVSFEGGDPSYPLWLGLFTGTLDPVGPAAPEVIYTITGGTTGPGAIQPTFTGAPMFAGSYVKNGPLVHFQVQVEMDNITSFGAGQYYIGLPFAAKYPYQIKGGCLHDASTGNQYAIGGHVAAGQTQLLLTFTNSNGQDDLFDHNSPVTLNVADNFHVAGSYIAQ